LGKRESQPGGPKKKGQAGKLPRLSSVGRKKMSYLSPRKKKKTWSLPKAKRSEGEQQTEEERYVSQQEKNRTSMMGRQRSYGLSLTKREFEVVKGKGVEEKGE